ncbi:MAG TPA: bifunctional pyr operon transcriptional regulator/uracil phosphoribosyltransferase PyrR [Chitinophagaceae bacterium]|nr:bifunctional pyr operon transcriptional regulator/uracil phosphoribosyltransferase PyrR [Chitinophagaceae bacterium]
MQVLLSSQQLSDTIQKLTRQLANQHKNIDNLVFAGIQQGGVLVADEMVKEFEKLFPGKKIPYGQLDITFYRDDIRKQILAPDKMNLPFAIENKIIILIDDVLFTGRTIKAALDALLDYGRPAKVELCVLIDRKEHRQFPIQADYAGATLHTSKSDKVKLVRNDQGHLEVVLIPA